MNWNCKSTWKRAKSNTLWCLAGCSIGDFGTIFYFQNIDHNWNNFEVMGLAIINGLITSIILETIILFKQMDFIVTETAYGTMGVVGLGGFGKSIFSNGQRVLGKLPEVSGQATRWGQKNLDQFAVSTKSFSTKLDSEFVNQKYWFEQQQKQLKDLAEAGQEQANKLADGFKNAFTEENMSDGMLKGAYGAYKNGSKMMGQGLTKARDGLTQVIKDIQEIKHTKFTGKKGSTNSVVSQTDMAKAAKSGISLGTLKKVYNRGMAAWKTGHRPGTNPQQWGI